MWNRQQPNPIHGKAELRRPRYGIICAVPRLRRLPSTFAATNSSEPNRAGTLSRTYRIPIRLPSRLPKRRDFSGNPNAYGRKSRVPLFIPVAAPPNASTRRSAIQAAPLSKHRSPAKQFGSEHCLQRGGKHHAKQIPDASECRAHLRTMKTVRDRGDRACM